MQRADSRRRQADYWESGMDMNYEAISTIALPRIKRIDPRIRPDERGIQLHGSTGCGNRSADDPETITPAASEFISLLDEQFDAGNPPGKVIFSRVADRTRCTFGATAPRSSLFSKPVGTLENRWFVNASTVNSLSHLKMNSRGFSRQKRYHIVVDRRVRIDAIDVQNDIAKQRLHGDCRSHLSFT